MIPTVNCVKIMPMENHAVRGLRYMGIRLYIGGLIFRMDVCCARDVRLAKIMAEESEADWYVHPDCSEYVLYALAGGNDGPPRPLPRCIPA